MFGGREVSAVYFLGELTNRATHGFSEVREVFYETRFEVDVQTQEILQHQDLAIAVDTSANSDCRDAESLGDGTC